MRTIRKVYVDQDGVLADYVAAVEALGYELEDISSEENKADFREKHYPNGFFKSLPEMEGLKLISYLEDNDIDYEILTAVSESYTERVASEKLAWLIEKLGFEPKFNYVVHSKDKAEYAREDVLLIDDREKSTVPFEAASGQVLLYKNYASAIVELEELLDR